MLNTNHIFPPSLCRCHSDFFLKKNAYTDVHKHACILLGSGTRAPSRGSYWERKKLSERHARVTTLSTLGVTPDNRAPRRT